MVMPEALWEEATQAGWQVWPGRQRRSIETSRNCKCRGLLDLVPYLIPQYTNTTVTFCSANEEPQVKADYAGGFFGEMQSGKVA